MGEVGCKVPTSFKLGRTGVSHSLNQHSLGLLRVNLDLALPSGAASLDEELNYNLVWLHNIIECSVLCRGIPRALKGGGVCARL